MMTVRYKTLNILKENAILTIYLNRPSVKNAINNHMIEELTSLFEEIYQDDSLKGVVLQGKGDVFSSGADLNWLKESLTPTAPSHKKEVERLYDLFELMDRCPVPLIGVVKKYALGGALGFVSICDTVICDKEAMFGLSEVRIGLVPAIIGPFVIKKIGLSAARNLFLSGTRFNAKRAYDINLVHQITPSDKLDDVVQTHVNNVLSGSPKAIRKAKYFLSNISSSHDQRTVSLTTFLEVRQTDEAQEGMCAFLEKRTPSWLGKHV